MGGSTVEETFNGLGGGHCASSDLGGKVIECVHHSWVDDTCAVQEAAACFLESFDLFVSEGRCCDDGHHLLVFAADRCGTWRCSVCWCG